MVTLRNNNISLTIDVGYNYDDITDTDEFYYYLSLLCNNQPILFIPEHIFGNNFSDQNTDIIDFELNDEKLSNTLLSALNNRTKSEIGRTYESSLDLSIEPKEYPNEKDDEWIIKVNLGSIFYGSSIPNRLEVYFDFYCSFDSLLNFTNELVQLENNRFTEYVEKYGKERYSLCCLFK